MEDKNYKKALFEYYSKAIPTLEKVINMIKEKYYDKTVFSGSNTPFELSGYLKYLNTDLSIKENQKIIKDAAVKDIKALNIEDKDLRYKVFFIMYSLIAWWDPCNQNKQDMLNEMCADMDMTSDELINIMAKNAKELDKDDESNDPPKRN